MILSIYIQLSSWFPPNMWMRVVFARLPHNLNQADKDQAKIEVGMEEKLHLSGEVPFVQQF